MKQNISRSLFTTHCFDMPWSSSVVDIVLVMLELFVGLEIRKFVVVHDDDDVVVYVHVVGVRLEISTAVCGFLYSFQTAGERDSQIKLSRSFIRHHSKVVAQENFNKISYKIPPKHKTSRCSSEEYS